MYVNCMIFRCLFIVSPRSNFIHIQPGIKATFELRHLYYLLHTNAGYFLDHVDRIMNEDYTPTRDDYLRIRLRSGGFDFFKGTLKFHELGQETEWQAQFIDFDGGRRARNTKWRKYLSAGNTNPKTFIWVMSIADYNEKMFEDIFTFRLIESLRAFAEFIQYFDGCQLIVFFNKYDIFKDKIKKFPINVVFPDFPSDKDPYNEDEVARFIAFKLWSGLVRHNIKLKTVFHIHRTAAISTQNMQKVLSEIYEQIVDYNLKQKGY